MMKNPYRQFQLTLFTLAPVHIGSGQVINSKEYIYENGECYFPEMDKLYDSLVRQGKAELFEAFLLKGTKAYSNKQFQAPERLNSFLTRARVSSRDFGGYRIALGKSTRQKPLIDGDKLNTIHQFTRDELGKPYVPGTSLKGAIRTILMNTYWAEKDFKMKIPNKKGQFKERSAVIPWGARKPEQDDIFHEIRVSDSQPLSNERLLLAQKWDYSISNMGKGEAKPLPIFRESIAPLTKLTFTITTTSERAANLIENLEKSAQEFYQLYREFFLQYLPANYRQDNLQHPIYLGAGSGVWTKTVMKQANGNVQKRYERMKTKMVRKGVYKLTKAPNLKNNSKPLIKNLENFYEMGKCCFTIKEIR